LKSGGARKTLSLVDPQKRSLRSNTVIEKPVEASGTGDTKKREKKAQEKK